MARVDIDPISAFNAVVSQLQTSLSLNDETCYLSLLRDVPPPAPTDVWLVVTPDGGTFPADMEYGGGTSQITVETGFEVVVFSTVRIDSSGKDTLVLKDASRGIYAYYTKIIRALAQQDLTSGANTFLREFLRPTGIRKPERLEDSLAMGGVTFDLSFDWSMS